MTKFAVFETVKKKVLLDHDNEKYSEKYVTEDFFLLACMVSFNGFLLIFGIIGCVLDKCDVLLLYGSNDI